MTGNWLSGKHCSRCLRCILPAVLLRMIIICSLLSRGYCCSLRCFREGVQGSTSGGYQEYAVADCGACHRNEFKHLLHPNAVLPVRINKQTVSSSIVTTRIDFLCFLSGSDPDWVDGSFVFGSWLFRVRQYGYFEYRQCRSGIGNLRACIFVEFFT